MFQKLPPLPADTVARLRHLYEERRDLKVDDILAAEGVTRHQLMACAAAEGWRARKRPPARDPRQRRAGRGTRVTGHGCPGLAACPERTALVGRLWAAVESQIAESEARLSAHGEGLEFEREARTLAVLVRTLQHLAALDAAAPQKAEADAAPGTDRLDELCVALETRLASLDGAGRSGASAGGAG